MPLSSARALVVTAVACTVAACADPLSPPEVLPPGAHAQRLVLADLSTLDDLRDRVIGGLPLPQQDDLQTRLQLVYRTIERGDSTAVAAALDALRDAAAQVLEPADLTALDLTVAELARQAAATSSITFTTDSIQ